MYGEPISQIIRERLKKSHASFLANDNISDFITKEELGELQKEVAQKVSSLMDSLIIDVENDHNTMDTANRVAKFYITELFSGRYTPPPSTTVFPNVKKLESFYIVGPISFNSSCAHHLVPIVGEVWIGLDPKDDLLGLSKFHRITEWVMARPQIQEEATVQVLEYIEELIKPKGIAVLINASHYCMQGRGVKDPEILMKSFAASGTLNNEKSKTDFLQLIRLNG
ncbi:GTP cyclohydrolase I [Flexibacterium corallicola]|uniref:GTP cyclohydrolase I n=1 Tax=Flexibacterium corallicola TaxID=3037259 RepID=UPI00286F1B6D|nr:GTP cyclohydrolase I [Pseudovibrio sp. M1P-2-3]